MMPDWTDSWYNRFAGQRLWVLASGPSLHEIEPYIPALKSEYTWAVNYTYRWDPIKAMRPTFYGCSEVDFLPSIDEVAKRYCDTLICCNVSPPQGEFARWKWVYKAPEKLMEDGCFQGLGTSLRGDKLLPYVVDGRNVVLDVCVQMGCWFGFKEIYLAGCDFTPAGHVYGEGSSKREGRNPDNIERCKKTMLVAYQAMALAGRTLATVTTSSLDIPKVGLEFLLGGKS